MEIIGAAVMTFNSGVCTKFLRKRYGQIILLLSLIYNNLSQQKHTSHHSHVVVTTILPPSSIMTINDYIFVLLLSCYAIHPKKKHYHQLHFVTSALPVTGTGPAYLHQLLV